MNELIVQLHKKLHVIYTILVISALAFSIVCMILVQLNLVHIELSKDSIYIFTTGMYLVVFAGIPIGYFIKQIIIPRTSNNLDSTSKIKAYYQIAIIRFVLYDAICIITSIIYVCVGNKQLLLFMCVSTILLLLQKPKINSITEELKSMN